MEKENMMLLDFVLIHYPTMTKLATYYGYDNGVYTFRDRSGIFGVTEKYKKEHGVTFEVIPDV